VSADAGGPYTGNDGEESLFDGETSYGPDSVICFWFFLSQLKGRTGSV